MDIEGERIIAADRASVWRALNDPDVLKVCISGCDELEKTSPTSFAGQVTQKVGPVKARFRGAIELSDIVEGESYRIEGEGKGGAAGFAKGSADVRLDDAAEGTRLAYSVDAKVGGKLAQLGSRLIDGFARKQANQFFDRFAEEVGGVSGGATPVDQASDMLVAEEAAPAVIDRVVDGAADRGDHGHPAEAPGAAGPVTRDEPVTGASMTGDEPVATQAGAGPAGGTEGAYQATMAKRSAEMAAHQDDPDRVEAALENDPMTGPPDGPERARTDGVVGDAGGDPGRVAARAGDETPPPGTRAEPQHRPGRGEPREPERPEKKKGWLDWLLGR